MLNHRPLTTGQAAEYCHVSQATMVNWIKDRRLKAYTTPGGHRRILHSDLVAFLEAHNMPIDPALRQATGPRLLLVGDTPRIKSLAEALTARNGFEIFIARSDYEASAEVMRAEPDAVLIDMKTPSDPLGLCRWVSDSSEDITLVVIGEGKEKGLALAAGADAYVAGEALPALKRLTALLE
jgi:excisionase family DNA binding protein